MSIRKEIVKRLVDSRVPFLNVKVNKDDDLNGEPAVMVRVEDIKNGVGSFREWKFAKRNNMSEVQIADVVMSYLTNGKINE